MSQYILRHMSTNICQHAKNEMKYINMKETYPYNITDSLFSDVPRQYIERKVNH